jgi:hypothetical protein
MCLPHHFRVKPMTFEYHWIKMFGSMKIEFIYFFNSSIILDLVKANRKASKTCGFLIGPTLVVACCAKTISINVIPRKCPNPIDIVIGCLYQIGNHRQIVMEPLKVLSPPTDVLVPGTSDSHAGVHNDSTSSVICVFMSSSYRPRVLNPSRRHYT